MEAIDTLKNLKKKNGSLTDEERKALRIAIEVLERKSKYRKEAKRWKNKALKQRFTLDKIRIEIGKSKTKHEMQIAENNIKTKLLISDIYCDIINIFDKYKE